ncbi:hypothetical protein Psi01_68410 [Planobispora siamensis]|uniref:Uncharacterized protein n=1 Tax=Planobispora siamensis TaxID=936338 RepID=A0A8J3WQV1_9ACTN|nr:hypothetical protein Psi01_68410 [Planobispora siamensis]
MLVWAARLATPAILVKFVRTTPGVACWAKAPITQRWRAIREKSSLPTRERPYHRASSPESVRWPALIVPAVPKLPPYFTSCSTLILSPPMASTRWAKPYMLIRA